VGTVIVFGTREVSGCRKQRTAALQSNGTAKTVDRCFVIKSVSKVRRALDEKS
jgi:hypothetical protein